ncbi:MAG: chemotaxis response regulator protein-glutamate methylesterase [Alphaproteobacteria bacterium]|nr:chemotaxis response regulator protein-glutamate methylesterase [Alphaproteobacteria bacterium]
MLADDSSVIRSALTRIIDSDPDIKIVSSVSNGELAVSSARRHKPNIIILDIEMPVMDGLTALPKIQEVSPESKIIMFSSLTNEGASETLRALTLGAVECIVKPSSARDVGEGSDFQREILNTIKGLVPIEQRKTTEETTQPTKPAPLKNTSFTLHNDSGSYKGKPELIAIGSSTGGPQALFNVLKEFKNFNIPIVITQHMPPTFTKILADHIEQHTGIPTHEGAEGMILENGHIYVAPGSFHMLLVKNKLQTAIHIDDGKPENFCKPAIDPMLRSALNIYGNKTLAVILTGMGNDGLNAAKMLVEKGGRLIAQDEETSVVWGMPGAVAKAGLCSHVLPVQDIGTWVRKAVLGWI